MQPKSILIFVLLGGLVFFTKSRFKLFETNVPTASETAKGYLGNKLKSSSCSTLLKRRVFKDGYNNWRSYEYAMENIYKPLGFEIVSSCTVQPWLRLVKTGQNLQGFCKQTFIDWMEQNKKIGVRPPPNQLSEEDIPKYTMNNSSKLAYSYYNEATNSDNVVIKWNRQLLDRFKNNVRNKKWQTYEDTALVYQSILSLDLLGKRVAVIGSLTPWMEATLLVAKVREIVTIDYNRIMISGEPKMSYLHALEAAERYINGTLEPFDFIGSYSSIEHSGLGRYGDYMTPNGDIIEMLKCWCWLKPGGYMLFGAPLGPDKLNFNAARFYGPIRLPLITAGFKVISLYDRYNSRLQNWDQWKDDEFVYDLSNESFPNVQRPMILQKALQ